MSAADQAGLRTGEVAEQAGVNIQTLRYHERRGLLAAPRRSNGGHRLYPPDTVALLNVIKAAQRLGFTLDEVADLLDAGRRRHPTSDLRERAARTLQAVLSEYTDPRRRLQVDGSQRDRDLPAERELPLDLAVVPGHVWRRVNLRHGPYREPVRVDLST